MTAPVDATREARRKKGEIRDKVGLAIINPYGGIWTDEIFDTPEVALAFLKREYPGAEVPKFHLTMAVQTTEIYRELGDPQIIPFPTT